MISMKIASTATPIIAKRKYHLLQASPSGPSGESVPSSPTVRDDEALYSLESTSTVNFPSRT